MFHDKYFLNITCQHHLNSGKVNFPHYLRKDDNNYKLLLKIHTMKLLDILNEVQSLNGYKVNLKESSKKRKTEITDLYKKKFKLLKATKKKINWDSMDPKTAEVRNSIISAYMANKPTAIISDMEKNEIVLNSAVAIFRALEVAHGGLKQLLSKSGDKKKFFQQVFDYINAIPEAALTTEDKTEQDS